MAITTVSQLVLSGKQTLPHVKPNTISAQAASSWESTWTVAGNPAAGAVPSSGVGGNTLTSATTGAIPFTDPASGLTYLVQTNLAFSFGGGAIYLYDRLWHNSGLSPTTITSQTVNSVALPSRCPVITDPTGRTFDANGLGVEAWLDVTTVMGAGTVAPTISYTDEAGNAGSTATLQQWVTAGAVGRCFPFDRAAGDRGVRSIQSYQQTATQTSGVFNLTLRRRIASFGQLSGQQVQMDWGSLCAPVIPNSACLEILYQSNSSANFISVTGTLTLAQE